MNKNACKSHVHNIFGSTTFRTFVGGPSQTNIKLYGIACNETENIDINALKTRIRSSQMDSHLF